jgi:glutathione synthase/RimK-type ligase-like ATP-grasp enzyme
MIYLLKNKKSKSARSLAKALGVKCITLDKLHKVKNNDTVINWGVSSNDEDTDFYTINSLGNVSNASCKLETFRLLSANGISIPPYMTHMDTVKDYLREGQWKKVVCRTKLRSYGGRGIVIARTDEEVVEAPLYTKYIKKDNEFRVHVIHGSVRLTQVKLKLSPESLEERGITEVNNLIRNLDNGWVFSSDVAERLDDNLLSEIRTLAINTAEILGLNFCAVDIILSKKGKLYVLEANTAPGLSDITLPIYSKYILSDLVD